MTKAAALSLSRVFADEYAGTGVLVNAVTPGAVAGPLWEADGGLADQAAEAKGITREEALEAQAGKIPLGRMAEPGRDRRRHRLPVLRARLHRHRRRLVRRRRLRARDPLGDQ